jgi:hypothetical protein
MEDVARSARERTRRFLLRIPVHELYKVGHFNVTLKLPNPTKLYSAHLKSKHNFIYIYIQVFNLKVGRILTLILLMWRIG